MNLDDEIDALYSVAPAEFIEARKALAARLKKAGDKDGAARIAALAKPTPAAWAVNQLHRAAKGDLDELLGIGEALREAHRQGASGVRDVFATQQAQRAAIDALTRVGQSLLEKAGATASETTLARIGETLTSISTLNRWGDGEPGRLSRELSPPGFDALLEVLGGDHEIPARKVAPKATPPAKPAKAPAGAREAVESTREAVETQRKAAAHARRAAEAKVTEAQRDKERAEARANEARQAALEARQAEKEAETEARRLAQVVRAAEEALVRAKREANEAVKEASAAADRVEEARALADEAARAKEAATAQLTDAKAVLEAARRDEKKIA